MKTVWKYPLACADDQIVNLPIGATVLHAREQHGALCIWALVDSDKPAVEPHHVHIAGTGHPIEHSKGIRYISTLFLEAGFVVLHVFEFEMR